MFLSMIFVNVLSEDAPLWRMFCPDFKGEAEIVACADGEEGFNRTIRDNFRLPDRAALEAVLPQGKGIVDLGALGDPAAMGVPKQAEPKISDKRARKKKTHEAVVIPPLVPEVAGVSRTRQKAPKLRKTRATAIPKSKPAVTIETREEPVSLFATPTSSSKVADMEVQKEGRRSPSIEVVSGGGTPPYVHVEETAKETAGVTIADTLDSANNLIDPYDAGRQGGEKPKSSVIEKPSGSTATGTGGLGTPFEAARARGLPRQNQINQLSSMLVGSSIIANAIMEDYHVLGRREEETIRLRAEAEEIVKAAREGAEQLEKIERLLRSWSRLRLGLHPPALNRENEKLFRVRQELTNLKAANAALVKEKAVAEVAAKEAEARGATALKEAEARAYKALEEADADRTKLNKAVEELKAEVQNQVAILEEVSARATEAEACARQVEEVRNGLTASLN
ncbi:hypothetical protein HanHA300_Chr05g0174921 [Helianthus annuus]|nr:hypothetical protein HanHA300_Chr05g0174921 [Helianthus annuus]